MDKNAKELTHWSDHSCRNFLKESDIQHLKKLLAHKPYPQKLWDDLKTNLTLREKFLDQKELSEIILNTPHQIQISSELFFYVLLRRELLKRNIDNRNLTDYIVSVLNQGLHVGEIFDMAAKGSRTMFYPLDFMEKINGSAHDEQFLLRIRLANQCLFIAGLFKEHIDCRVRTKGAPNLGYYEEVGSSQYYLASQYSLALEFELNNVFAILSSYFGPVRIILNELSETVFSLGEPFN